MGAGSRARTLDTLSFRTFEQYQETLEIAAEKRNRVNAEIVAETVRLISESGEQIGIVGRAEALSIAEEAGLDLVEISPNTEPPVCRLMDFGKFLFQQNKRRGRGQKEAGTRTGQGDQVPPRNGRGGLPDEAPQPEAIPVAWRQDEGDVVVSGQGDAPPGTRSEAPEAGRSGSAGIGEGRAVSENGRPAPVDGADTEEVTPGRWRVMTQQRPDSEERVRKCRKSRRIELRRSVSSGPPMVDSSAINPIVVTS